MTVAAVPQLGRLSAFPRFDKLILMRLHWQKSFVSCSTFWKLCFVWGSLCTAKSDRFYRGIPTRAADVLALPTGWRKQRLQIRKCFFRSSYENAMRENITLFALDISGIDLTISVSHRTAAIVLVPLHGKGKNAPGSKKKPAWLCAEITRVSGKIGISHWT